jgi:transposase
MVEDIFDQTRRVARVEIRTGVGRRRRWTAEQKASVVAESFAPGAVVSAVARRHEISPQHLFQWRKAARLGRLVLPIDDEPLFAAVLLEQAAAQRRPDTDT